MGIFFRYSPQNDVYYSDNWLRCIKLLLNYSYKYYTLKIMSKIKFKNIEKQKNTKFLLEVPHSYVVLKLQVSLNIFIKLTTY